MTINLKQELKENELKIRDLNKEYKQMKDENQRLEVQIEERDSKIHYLKNIINDISNLIKAVKNIE
jgi:cell division septum initiation protein DivIVA